MNRPVLFYAQWALGYHNREAELKATAIAQAGHRVVYVVGIGIRNPGPRQAAKLIDRIGRKLDRGGGTAIMPSALEQAGLAVMPPRQLAPVRRLNEAWVARQLERAVGPLGDALAWVRWPTPELVGALRSSPPRGVVYECVDAYHLTPGITGRWRAIFAAAETALVRMADRVVVPGPSLARRFKAMGARVEIVPHGVSLERFPSWAPRARRTPATIGFVGTLDYRIDMQLVRAVALARPAWQLRFAGPVQEGFDPSALADLANVTVEPPVPYDQVGKWLAELDAGFMPYRRDELYTYLNPLKALEFLAAGKPAVAPRTAALEHLAGPLAFAGGPEEFVAELETAIAVTDEARATELRAIAERSSWQRSLSQVRTIVQNLA